MEDKLKESSSWYAEFVQLSVKKDKYVFLLGSNGYTPIDGRLNRRNAMALAANRAKELNAGWYHGTEIVKGFVIKLAGSLKNMLDDDENLMIYDLDGHALGVKVGEAI